jgi:hypothetical protein
MMRPSTPPDDHRAATEVPRTSGQPPAAPSNYSTRRRGEPSMKAPGYALRIHDHRNTLSGWTSVLIIIGLSEALTPVELRDAPLTPGPRYIDEHRDTVGPYMDADAELTPYLSGESSSVDPEAAVEPGIEPDIGICGGAGRPHCHRHSARSQKQLTVCWCGGSSGRYGAGCGVAVAGCGDMAVAFLRVVSAQVGVLSFGLGTLTASPPWHAHESRAAGLSGYPMSAR